ncbi:MAG: dienelactone hydrolase [Noviherbaspirillum sp.]
MHTSIMFVMALLASWVMSAQAAGFQMVNINDGSSRPMQLAIWYPSAAPTAVTAMGPGVQNVAAGGEIEGDSLPLVMVSHGTGGSAFSHFDTALALANAGFVVAAVAHPGDNHADQSHSVSVLDRPTHVVRAIDYMLAEWRDHERIDAQRIGMFGFSAGGFTALVNAGGKPDLTLIGPHCAKHAADFACMLLSRHNGPMPQTALTPTADLRENRIRAAVVAAPALGFTFGDEGLRDVRIPVQLWRAEDDTLLPHPWYAEAVRNSLPAAPEYHVVPKAGHFDFLPSCSERLAAIAPQICTSQQGFDRGAFHERFNAEVVAFFNKTLRQ